MHRARLLSLVALVAAACRPPALNPTDNAADVAAVQRIAQEAASAHQAGDSVRLASLFTQDAIVLTDGGPSINGRAAITSMFGEMVRQFRSTVSIRPVETEVAGNWAFMRTAVSGTLRPTAGGAPIQIDLKEIAIARRQPDGSWKVARLIGNSNRSPRATMDATLAGAWRFVRATPVASTEQTVAYTPGANLFIFTRDGYYSMAWTRGAKADQPFAQRWQPTDAERVARYNALTMNAGTYTVTGNRLTIRPLVARAPDFVRGTGTYEFRLSGDTLVLTDVDIVSFDNVPVPGFAAAGRYRHTLTRLR